MNTDDPITAARLRLMLDEPYLASALARLPFVDSTDAGWVDTMATDGYHILFNRPFAEELTGDELKFVIAHELFHCVLGHLDRRGDRDRLRWNYAIDYATNALLVAAGLQMPSIALFEHRYTGMTAEDIYSTFATPPRASDSCRYGVGIVSSPAAAPASAQQPDRPTEVSGLRRPSDDRDSAPGGFDRHVSPDDDRMKTLGQACGNMPSREERRRIRISLAGDLVRKLQGTAAGRALAEVQASTERAVPWEHLLAQFVSGLRRSDYRMFPFHRKHLWRGLYLPTIGAPGPQHLVVAVDTSGSMSDDDLAQIAGELDRLRSVSECALTILQFDAAIQHVERREACNVIALDRERLYGRGGTDIRLPFTWLASEMRAGRLFPPPDALIVITDGCGPMPPEPPEYPVLWIATSSAIPQFPYGNTIRLPARGARCRRA